MDTFARNALRVSLAGAGIVVLGASYVGQASADETPDTTSETTSDSASDSAPGTSGETETAPDSPLATPTADELLAPDSLDTFVLPTVSDMTGL